MPLKLNSEEEIELIKKSCDKSNKDRQADKNNLLNYLWGTYLGFLIYIAKSFEYTISGKLPGEHEDICKDFILEVMEKDKLCRWKSLSLKSSLATMFRNYLVDRMREHCKITYKVNSCGVKVKDEYGNYIVENIVVKKPVLTTCESIFVPTEEAEGIEENPEIHKGKSIYHIEQKFFDDLMLKRIKNIQKRALLELQKVSRRDADIIYMELKGISRPDIASELGIEPGGINTTVKRAYVKYAIIFHRILKEEGIDTKISTDELIRLLIDVTRGGSKTTKGI